MGLWEWAIYVLLTLTDTDQCPTLREDAVKTLLDKHVEDLMTHPEKEAFLTTELGVPPNWIHVAKATYAHYNQQYQKEVEHLKATGEHWQQMHTLVVDHLAPDALLDLTALTYSHAPLLPLLNGGGGFQSHLLGRTGFPLTASSNSKIGYLSQILHVLADHKAKIGVSGVGNMYFVGTNRSRNGMLEEVY